MKKRKNTVILLIAAMVLSLAACGKQQDVLRQEESESEETQVESLVSQESLYSEESEGQTEESDSQETAVFEDKVEDVSVEDLKTTASLEETILVDENDIKITVTGMEYTEYDIKLKLMLENNSDKSLSFTSGSAGYSCNAVNGYMVDEGYLNVDIAAGKKANESISFSRDELSLYGITEIADIQLGFVIRDEDFNRVYIGPRQVRTSVADSYDYEEDTYRQLVSSGAWEKLFKCTIDYFAEEELYHQDGVKIISEALMTNKDGEKLILLEVQNDSEDLVTVGSSDIMVNGLMIYDYTWSIDFVNPKARRIISLPVFSMLDEPYREAFNILDIGEFTFSFALYNSDIEKITEPQEIGITISEKTAAIDDTGDELYNENGIRIISKGLFEDTLSYIDDIHMCLLIENSSPEKVSIDGSYNSLSVNGFMTDFYSRGWKVPSGKYAFADITIRASSLEDNGITSIEDITEIEITFDIKDEDYDAIAKPVILISYQ